MFTGGNVLPRLVDWLVILKALAYRGANRFISIKKIAELMEKKLEKEIDDSEMIMGWFMIFFFDIRWGGKKISEVHDVVMSLPKCAAKWGSGRNRPFVSTPFWLEMRNEFVKYAPIVDAMGVHKGFGDDEVEDEEETCPPSSQAVSIVGEKRCSVDSEATVSNDSRKRCRAQESELVLRADDVFNDFLSQHCSDVAFEEVVDEGEVGYAHLIDMFLEERMALGNNSEVNQIMWWKEKKKKYKVLSTMALLFLSQPASSSSSERLFSCAGHINRQRRGRLTGANIEMLACLSWNLRKKLFD